jgi:hypothetical protein
MERNSGIGPSLGVCLFIQPADVLRSQRLPGLVPDCFFGLGVKKDHVLDAAAGRSGKILGVALDPGYIIPKIFNSKYFIHYYLYIMTDFTVNMDINGANLRQKLPGQNKPPAEELQIIPPRKPVGIGRRSPGPAADGPDMALVQTEDPAGPEGRINIDQIDFSGQAAFFQKRLQNRQIVSLDQPVRA